MEVVMSRARKWIRMIVCACACGYPEKYGRNDEGKRAHNGCDCDHDKNTKKPTMETKIIRKTRTETYKINITEMFSGKNVRTKHTRLSISLTWNIANIKIWRNASPNGIHATIIAFAAIAAFDTWLVRGLSKWYRKLAMAIIFFSSLASFGCFCDGVRNTWNTKFAGRVAFRSLATDFFEKLDDRFLKSRAIDFCKVDSATFFGSASLLATPPANYLYSKVR